MLNITNYTVLAAMVDGIVVARIDRKQGRWSAHLDTGGVTLIEESSHIGDCFDAIGAVEELGRLDWVDSLACDNPVSSEIIDDLTMGRGNWPAFVVAFMD